MAALGALAALAALSASAPSAAQLPVVDYSQPAARDTEPVVLTGGDFGDWSAPANQTVRLPLQDLSECQTFDEQCDHNHYADSDADTGNALGDGTPVNRLLGYRWDAKRGWRQIPFQVDQRFARYLSNPASGFSFYSGEDKHTTYAYDREGFRWWENDPDNVCLSRPASPVATDPVKGLDANDEVAFMASDAGPVAPEGAPVPAGVEAVKQVALADPTNPSGAPRYVYVAKAGRHGPKPAFGASNGYVRYERDANADLFEKSESAFEGYGNARRGPYCDNDGNVVLGPDGQPDIQRRRPRDYASITTDRYKFRYDGRWLMTRLNISPDGGKSYGPDVIDRWKARAFAQDPGSETPCCGFEEEDTNWGGSSTLLGERTGPVRAIRETWGADSGTNVIRRETFYRDELRQDSYLRVHPIPPLDGIYAQWDFNAGRMTRFYNPRLPEGVPVDGRNDEAYGNLDDPCNERYDDPDDAQGTSDVDQRFRDFYRSVQLCRLPYHQSIDVADLSTSDLNSSLQWAEVAGPYGTIVDRYSAKVRDLTPGGLAQSLVALPYYRDDSCFDDGTGTDPGPKLHLRSGDEPRVASDGTPRRCWHPEDGMPDGSDRFYQGSIATHGVHLLFLLDSDNARLTEALTEITSEQRMVMLPGDPGNVGEKYGRGFEKPLLAVTTDFAASTRR